MHPGPKSSGRARQGPIDRLIARRRFTVFDGMILTGAVAIGCWAGIQELVWLLDPHDPEPWLFWTRRARLTFIRTAPFGSVVTMALLALRLLPPRPSRRRLACQPGFVACLAASLVLIVGGSMTFSGVSRNSAAPLEGPVFQRLLRLPAPALRASRGGIRDCGLLAGPDRRSTVAARAELDRPMRTRLGSLLDLAGACRSRRGKSQYLISPCPHADSPVSRAPWLLSSEHGPTTVS